MTDNEIIKALKCFCGKVVSCNDCAYKTDPFTCITNVARDALDLIDRQKEEIERLKAAINEHKICQGASHCPNPSAACAEIEYWKRRARSLEYYKNGG